MAAHGVQKEHKEHSKGSILRSNEYTHTSVTACVKGVVIFALPLKRCYSFDFSVCRRLIYRIKARRWL